jgi:hypothetical protein
MRAFYRMGKGLKAPESSQPLLKNFSHGSLDLGFPTRCWPQLMLNYSSIDCVVWHICFGFLTFELWPLYYVPLYHLDFKWCMTYTERSDSTFKQQNPGSDRLSGPFQVTKLKNDKDYWGCRAWPQPSTLQKPVLQVSSSKLL